MPRSPARLLRAFLAISVPSCYWIAGLYCLLSLFRWHETVTIGVIHLLIFVVAQRIAYAYFKPLLFFMGLVFLGMLVILAVWIGWKGDIYGSFSLAAVGSIAWSITSWECITYLCYIRARQGRLHTAFSSITRADQLIVLMTPMIIAGIIGVIHAMTNSVTVSDRLQDFLLVGELGVACGVFLALPWFSLPLILSGTPDRRPSE